VELTALYRRMHLEGESFLKIPAGKVFPGESLPPQAARIKRLIARTGSLSILDYGSGKGRQYDKGTLRLPDGSIAGNIQDYWDVDYVQCYDPSYPPLSRVPQGKFDGVISTDVLEHCPEEDLEWIVEELFAYAEKFVFASIACYPARKRLPNGENAHCTVQPVQWWEELFRSTAARHPGVQWEAWLISKSDTAEGPKAAERRIGSAEA
jgi:hypothetical protein